VRSIPGVAASESLAPESSETTVATVLCNNDCGGRCHLKAHVKDGKVLRISTDDAPDSPQRPQLRGCLKGRSLARFFANPNRLTYPLKRPASAAKESFSASPGMRRST